MKYLHTVKVGYKKGYNEKVTSIEMVCGPTKLPLTYIVNKLRYNKFIQCKLAYEVIFRSQQL